MMEREEMQREYFVYDGLEVIRTGRIASRNSQVKTYKGSSIKAETVVEIMPIAAQGTATWKKWVREDELFVITDTSDSSDVQIDSTLEPLPEPGDNPLDKILNSLR